MQKFGFTTTMKTVRDSLSVQSSAAFTDCEPATPGQAEVDQHFGGLRTTGQ